MTFTQMQADYTPNDLQFIAIDATGKVLTSDDKLLTVRKDTFLKDIHAFFEIIPSCFEEQKKHVKFECVSLINDRIFDIEIIQNEPSKGVLILREGTLFYNRLQEIAQKRNESIIFNEVLEFKNELLKEKEEFKDQYIGNFSHEMRNPLTLIKAFSSMLLKTDLNVDQELLVESMITQSDKLQEIIEDIVDLSVIKRKGAKLQENQFDFFKLVEEVKLNNQLQATKKGTQILVDIETTIPQILCGDQRRVFQVVTNLFEHALTYSTGNQIHLLIAENHRRANKISISVKVKSTTVAIPENLKTNNVTKPTTTSLSLSIAEELLTLMDGELHNTQDTDRAAVLHAKFKLVVPLRVEATTSTSKKTKHADIRLAEKINVIIAEDYGVAQLTVVKVLLSSGNFETDVYADPKAILEAIQVKNYDVILMGSSISQIDATELLSMIREFGNNHNTKIPAIALTTQTKPEEIKRYKKAGFKDVVKKPYTDDDVLSTVYKRLNINKFK